MSQPQNPPANPIPGAIYIEDLTGTSWVWTGVSWITAGASGSYGSQVKTGMAITPGFYSGLSSSQSGGSNLAAIATQYGTVAPTNPSFGQIWVDTSDSQAPISYVWTDPGAWTKISDGVNNTSVGLTQPTVAEVGDGWLDTSTNELKIYTGALWQSVSAGSSSTSSALQSYAVAPAQPIAESSVYYNTTDDTVYYSTGTAWVALSSDPDADTNSILALTAPTTRADATALQAGDLWVDSSTNTLSYYTGTAWTRIASSTTGDTHSFYIDPAPTLRPDGTALVVGDMYVNSVSLVPYVWNGTTWAALKPLVDNDTNSILTASAPTSRANGDPLQAGDLWTESATHRLYYRTTLASWLPITIPSTYVQSFFGSGDPITAAIAARPGTTDALVNGDQYIDTATGNIFYWNGTTWIHFSERHSYTGSGSPIGVVTNRPNSGGQALVTGDQYIDTASNLLYYWNGSSWTATSSTAADTQGYATSGDPNATAPYSGATDSNGRSFVDGDNYVDTATGLMYYRTGAAWALISTGVDTQGYAASGEPSLIAPYNTTADSNGRTFLDGDQYVNTANNQAFYRTGGAWVAISPASDTQSFTGTGVPSLTQRPDTTALLDGDMYVDDATNIIYYYDLSATAWKATGATAQDTHSFTGTGAPTLTQRLDATALQDGDMYVDDATNIIYYYDLSATAWKATGAIAQDTHSFTGTGAPAMPIRPDATALQDGDMYVDDAANTIYFYDLSATAWKSTGGSVSSATPTVEGILYGYSNTSGNATCLGYQAGVNSTGDTNSVYVGNNVARSLTSSDTNTIVGGGALSSATNATSMTVIGVNALSSETNPTTLVGVTSIGGFTGDSGVTDNSIILSNGSGGISFFANSSGAWSTDSTITNFGTAGQVLTSQGNASPPIWAAAGGGGGGTSATPTAEGILYGRTELVTGGSKNVSLGRDALPVTGTGTNNVAIGSRAIGAGNLTTGMDNTVAGAYAASNLSSGYGNVCIGFNSGPGLTASHRNIMIGEEAGPTSAHGDGNICIGYLAGNDLSTGDRENTIIGCYRATAGTSQNIILARGGADTGDYNVGFQINQNNAYGIPVGNSITTTVNYGVAGQVLTSSGSGSAPTWTTQGFSVLEMGSSSIGVFSQEWLAQDIAIPSPITFTLPNASVGGAVKFSFATGNTQNITFSGTGTGANTFNGAAGNLVLTGAQVDGKTFTFTYVSQLVGWAVEGL